MKLATHVMVIAAVAMVLMAGSADAALVNGLSSHWSFDEDFNNSAEDARHGSAIADARITHTAGEYQFGGGALSLDGSGDFVDIVGLVFPNNPDAFTITAWANMQGTGSGGTTRVVWSTSPPYSSELSMRAGNATSGRPYWYAQNVENYNNSFTANNNEWHQYAVAWDRSNSGHFKYYVDGNLVRESTTDNSGDTFLNTTGFHIGADRNNGRLFNGYIDDVGVYNRALTEAEVLNLFHGASLEDLDSPPVRVARVESLANSAFNVLNESTGFNVNFKNLNFGDHELYSASARLKQTDGVIIGNPNDGDDSIVQVGGDLTQAPGDPRYDNGMAFSTSDVSGGGEKNFDMSFAHFPFAGKWIGGHVATDGTVLAGPNLPAGTTITPLDDSQARLGPGQFVVSMPGIDSRTDGMLFVVGGQNDDNYIGAGVFADPSNLNVLAGDASLGDWHVHIRNHTHNDTSDVGEDGTFSFIYLPYVSQLAPGPLVIENMLGGRVDTDGSVLNGAGAFTVNRPGTGTYHIQIPDGQGGFLTDDDGILILTASGIMEDGNSGNNIDAVEAGGITWQFDSINDWFEVLTFDAPSSGLDDTQFVFAFIQYDNPLALGIPEPSSFVLLGLAAVGLIPWRRRRKR